MLRDDAGVVAKRSRKPGRGSVCGVPYLGNFSILFGGRETCNTVMTSLATSLDRLPEVLAGRRRRIVVAMSGGVDSSVAAALLTRAGHEVIGLTLQLYAANGAGSGGARRRTCCAGEDIHDARRVAAALAIPHYVLDYENRFAADVMAPFAAAYAAGETPVPCIACNERIKFGPLLDTAVQLGAELMATGHYIDRRDGAEGAALHRAEDAERDQSYFLFATTRVQLERSVFPLGRLPKADVRALARELGLPVSEKADSQDICFVPDGRYAATVARLRPDAAEPGDIVHMDGRVLGRHSGIVHYTIGQRRGLGIAADEPLHVVAIDAASRQVVVGPRAALAIDRLELRGVNWLGRSGDDRQGTSTGLHVRFRSTGPLVPAHLTFGPAETASVMFEAAEYGIARGQACVFYADASRHARVLGGGWIAETERMPVRRATTMGKDAKCATEVAGQGGDAAMSGDAERGQVPPNSPPVVNEARGVQ